MNKLLIPILFSLMASCAHLSPKKNESVPLKIIDAHIHTRFNSQPERTSKIIVSQDQLLKEMKENNVVAAISLTGTNDEGYTDLKEHQIFHCAGLGTNIGQSNIYKRIDDGLKNQKYRCLKIYLGYVHAYAYSDVYEPAYELAKKHRVPVIFHTGDTYSDQALLKYADPLTIDEVAVKHREIDFIIAHSGNPWIESAAEVAYKNSNVYLDGSAFLIGDLSKTSPEHIEEYAIKPLRWIFGFLEDPSKLLYGSDWPLTGLKNYIELFKKAIPPEHHQAVFYDNAARLFKLHLK